MRIHSDFRDYYDYALGYGIDENVFYSRYAKEVEISFKSQNNFPRSRGLYLLGFCGHIYPIAKIEKINVDVYGYEYEIDEYEIIETFYAFSYEEYDQKEREWDNYSISGWAPHERESTTLKRFYTEWAGNSEQIFGEQKVPAWVLELGAGKGILNPKLSDYGFERIKDAATAFQDISMYLSNILIEQKEIVTVEDKYKIEQQGFDSKLSFRKGKKTK